MFYQQNVLHTSLLLSELQLGSYCQCHLSLFWEYYTPLFVQLLGSYNHHFHLQAVFIKHNSRYAKWLFLVTLTQFHLSTYFYRTHCL